MHKAKGYVVVADTPVQFKAEIETIIVPKSLYKVTVTFGNKVIYLDLKDGKSAMGRTLDGVLQILRERRDIRDLDVVTAEFIATDGAHSTSERLTRFRAVDLSSGRELFSKSIGN